MSGCSLAARSAVSLFFLLTFLFVPAVGFADSIFFSSDQGNGGGGGYIDGQGNFNGDVGLGEGDSGNFSNSSQTHEDGYTEYNGTNQAGDEIDLVIRPDGTYSVYETEFPNIELLDGGTWWGANHGNKLGPSPEGPRGGGSFPQS